MSKEDPKKDPLVRSLSDPPDDTGGGGNNPKNAPDQLDQVKGESEPIKPKDAS